MTNILTYAAIAFALGATAMVAVSDRDAISGSVAESRLNSDGAFRDGLYLGKLAAESGHSMRPAIGRWSTEEDRNMFAAGYHRGYSEALHRQ
jgi:hypothetical protein